MPKIRQKFFETIGDKNNLGHYQKAYIIILLKAFFELSSEGKMPFNKLASYIKEFYSDREEKGYKIESEPFSNILTNVKDTSINSIKSLMRTNPLKTKFLQGFLSEINDEIILNYKLWNSLSRDDIEKIKVILNGQLHQYFEERVDGDHMTIPDADYKKIEEALNEFDQEYREREEWANFKENKNYKYAIEYNERLYPVKKIISLATGAHVSSFSGGNEANSYVEGRGFKVIDLDRIYENEGKNIILEKKVDWSLFNWGLTVPLEYRDRLFTINREEVQPGTSSNITLLIQGVEFIAELRNINYSAGREALQIRYDGNKRLKSILKNTFNSSLNYILTEREKLKEEGQTRPHVDVPEELAEYIIFYETGEPYKYKVQLINKEQIKGNNFYANKELLRHICSYISSRGFIYPPGMIENFYLSLRTKPFVLLAGISGTGKTKLVKMFAEALGCTKENGRFELISVRPDWSDSSDLLGYRNIKDQFLPGPMINIIKRANEDPANPYFVCLDEMNLARMEYYFSDFLSKMETRRVEGGRIISDKLLVESSFGKDEGKKEKYKDLIIPDNLYIVGTVNMDETTHPFSKKVLDRANTIEFSDVDLKIVTLNEDRSNIVLSGDIASGFLKTEYVVLNDCNSTDNEIINEVVDRLQKINEILKKAYLHVGYRVRDEVCFYMIYALRDNLLKVDDAFDFQVLQKILPRIQGSSQVIKEVLIDIFKLASGKDFSIEEGDIGDKAVKYVNNISNEESILKYPRTAEKAAYMIKRMEEDGFTAYWL